MDPARLTVVIPMFNSESTVGQTIDSVRAQTFADWRIVVVNDGSTDAGPELVERMARDDDRITMITQPNRGLSGARNTGLERAIADGSEFVHFLDADDWMAPDAYDHLIAGAQETGASYGGYELCDANARSLGRQSPMSAPLVGLDELIEWNRAATHAILMRTELLAGERFDESLPCCEDYDMWLRLATRGVVFKGVERIVCGYRLRADSMSKKFGVMAATYQRVLLNNLALARRAGWEPKIDLSEQRITRVLGATNLAYATMEALRDMPGAIASAAALYDSLRRPSTITPAQAAQAACTATQFGSCIAPDAHDPAARRWLSALRQWWVRCAEEGCLSFDQLEPALVEFSRKVVHPGLIADAMLDDVWRTAHAAEHGVVILGLDRNSRRLIRNASARGWRVLAFDPLCDRREAELLEPLSGVRVLRDSSRLGAIIDESFAASPWIVGPVGQAADALMGEVTRVLGNTPRAARTWTLQRERMGDEQLRAMRAALAIAKAG